MTVVMTGNIPRARGKALWKIEVGTQSLADGGTFNTDLENPQIVLVETKSADHIAAVEDITGNVVTVAVWDMATPGTPAVESSAQDIQYVAIGY